MAENSREEFERMLEIIGAPPELDIPRECIDRAKPIHDLALKLYSAAVMSGVAKKQQLKDYLHIVMKETREILEEGKAEKFPLEHGLAIAERAEKLIDKGYIGTAAADLAQASWTLGKFHMLESAQCICSKYGMNSWRSQKVLERG